MRLGELEQRLETLRGQPAISVALLGVIFASLCPELYGSPRPSRRGTAARPGSCRRQKQYARRVARGRQVFSPLDVSPR